DLSKAEVDRLYAEHLGAVESVQTQLDAILRRLAAGRQSLPGYVEGLTDDGGNVFTLEATALSDVGAEPIPEARRSLAEAKKLGAGGRGPGEAVRGADRAPPRRVAGTGCRARAVRRGAGRGPRPGRRGGAEGGRTALAGRRAVRPGRRQGERGRD